MNPRGASGKGTPYLFHFEGIPYLLLDLSLMMSQVVTQCSPMRSEFTRTHEELDFSYAVCDTEAKLPQEVLELRLRERPPKTQWGIRSTRNRLYRWACMRSDCNDREVESPVEHPLIRSLPQANRQMNPRQSRSGCV